MRTSFDSLSECGRVRKINEDAIFSDLNRGFYAVADGMGGGAEGARASRMVCAAIERAEGRKANDFLAALSREIASVHDEIKRYSAEHGYSQMGSTLAFLAAAPGAAKSVIVGNIGDSRVYRLRAGRLEPLTRDHSVASDIIEKLGKDHPQAAALNGHTHPLSHMLTRVIGVGAAPQFDYRRIFAEPGDRFLICSDGLNDVIGDGELSRLLEGTSRKRVLTRLAKEIEKRGSPDNYTIVLVDVEGKGDE